MEYNGNKNKTIGWSVVTDIDSKLSNELTNLFCFMDLFFFLVPFRFDQKGKASHSILNFLYSLASTIYGIQNAQAQAQIHAKSLRKYHGNFRHPPSSD